MKNWLGQDIEVGSWVYRGARDGNTSKYKIGKVTKVNDDTRKATVEWYAEPVEIQVIDNNDFVTSVSAVRKSGWYRGAERPKGTSDIDTMVVIDDTYAENTLAKLEILENLQHAVPRRHEANFRGNPNWPGYYIKDKFDEFINDEMVARGLTA